MEHLSLAERLDALQAGLGRLLPEMLLAGGLLLVITLDLLAGQRRPWMAPAALLLGLLVSGIAVGVQAAGFAPGQEADLFLGLVRWDGTAIYFKLLLLVCLLFTVAFTLTDRSHFRDSPTASEYWYLLAGVAPGLFLMVSTGHLLMLYLATELVSLGSYVLAGYRLRSAASAEAGIKYLIYGAVSSGILLYGISLLYGLGGSLWLYSPEFGTNLAAAPAPAALLSLGLVFAGLAFKVSLVPFHFWVPDVYAGAPPAVAGFLASASKAAGFVLLLRFTKVLLPHETLFGGWQLLLAVAALAALVLGNVAALRQRQFRRLMAYSGIAHAGFLTLGLVAATPGAWAGLGYYLGVYVLMNLLAFSLAAAMEAATGSGHIDDWRARIRPGGFVSVVLVLLMVSLVGLPPTAGFIAKFAVLIPLWERYEAHADPLLLSLLVAALLGTLVSLAYYLRLPMAWLFSGRGQQQPTPEPLPLSTAQAALWGLTALALLMLGLIGFDAWLSLLGQWLM